MCIKLITRMRQEEGNIYEKNYFNFVILIYVYLLHSAVISEHNSLKY